MGFLISFGLPFKPFPQKKINPAEAIDIMRDLRLEREKRGRRARSRSPAISARPQVRQH
jgi:hypothetical protein